MSILKPKTSEGKIPADAFISFNGQSGKIRLEIRDAGGNSTKYEPSAVRYLVIDEDFKEVDGIKMGADQKKGVRSNVCHGWDNSYFVVKLNDGTPVGAGIWSAVKEKAGLYGGKLSSFSMCLLMKVQGTDNDAAINAMLAKNEMIAKVSYHGQTSFAYSTKQKEMSTRDFAGHIIQVKSFSQVKSQKSGLSSYVPNFEVSKADESSKEYLAGVSLYLAQIEPYIKYVKNGGTMNEVSGDAPEASEDDFVSDDSWIPKQEPADPTVGEPVTEDLPF